jgi:hypothetical protein
MKIPSFFIILDIGAARYEFFELKRLKILLRTGTPYPTGQGFATSATACQKKSWFRIQGPLKKAPRQGNCDARESHQ